jgi:DNA-binding NarL/FixJ family response regulator
MQVFIAGAAGRRFNPLSHIMFQAEGKEGGDGVPLRIDGRKLRVLVVEDDALIAMDLSVSISQLGGEIVDVSATAHDATRLVAELRPDVVLMDVRLRGEPDGIEAARIIQEGGSTPVTFVTGNSDSDTLRRMGQLSGAQIILKPVLINELRDAIIRASGR